MSEMQIGTVRHYFDKINVAVIDLTAPLKLGDEISVKGPATEFTIRVDSMQIAHDKVSQALAGQAIGLKVPEPVKEKDLVFRVEQASGGR